MIVLVLVHLFIMHYQHAPFTTGAAFVGRRWSSSAWRAFDWVLLLLALTHGLVGAHGALRETVRRPRARAALDGAFIAGACVFVGLGTFAVTAAPVTAAGGSGPLSGQAWIPAVLLGGLVAAATVTYAALAGVGMVLLSTLLRRLPIGWWHYPGQWAFAVNRTAGIGVLAFLLVHIVDVALVPLAPDLYERTVAGYAMPYLIPMEIALVTAVIYHALNGLRLMLLEALDRRGTAAQTPSFIIVVVVTVLLVLPSAAVVLGGRP